VSSSVPSPARTWLALIALGAYTLALGADDPAAIPKYIAATHRAVIQQWLAANSGYRVATDADCKCEEHIAGLRAGPPTWDPQPDFHPYYASGDFSGDGKQDFAVVFILIGKPQKLLAIFNGPFAKDRASKPAYSSRRYGMSLMYGASQPGPHFLVVGRFEAKEVALLPYKKTYKPR